jgi:hypothetical protein
VRVKRSLEQHDHRANQTRDTRVRACDGDEQNHACRGHVEKYEREDELPECCHCRNETDQPIYNASEEQRRNNAQRKDVKQDLDEQCHPVAIE